MLEKLKSSLKKSRKNNKTEQLAARILYIKSSDLGDEHSHKNAVQRLSRVLEIYLRIDRYNAANNKNEINSLIFKHLLNANLICINEHTQNRWKSNDPATMWLDAFNSGILVSFPCGLMEYNRGIETIKHVVLNTLKKHHPMLLTNKAFLTVMCIRQFHPQSFFSKLPKDVVKLIFNHAKNPCNSSDKTRTQQSSNPCANFNGR